jgi:hypothetical protein
VLANVGHILVRRRDASRREYDVSKILVNIHGKILPYEWSAKVAEILKAIRPGLRDVAATGSLL